MLGKFQKIQKKKKWGVFLQILKVYSDKGIDFSIT